jgi:hypothetical protein
MKKFLRLWWIPVLIAVIALGLMIRSRCEALPSFPGVSHLWDVVKPIVVGSHPEKPEPGGVTIHDKPVPAIQITDVHVDDGQVEITVALDSVTTQTIKFPLSSHGGWKLQIIEPDSLAADTSHILLGVAPRFGFDFEVQGGPTIHGAAAGLANLYWNNVVDDASLQLLAPNLEIELWDDSTHELYGGIGLSLQPFPSHTTLSLMGAWEWRLDQLKDDRITIGAYLALYDF